MTTIQSRMMGQAISERLYTGYVQANNQRLAQVASRNINTAQAAQSAQATQKAQATMGLHPTMSLAKVDLRTKALSFEQSEFLNNYRNNMLDMQSRAAEMLASRTEIRETQAAGSDNPAVAEVSGRLGEISDRYVLNVKQVATGQVSRSAPMEAEDPMPTASGSLKLSTEKGDFDFFMSGAGYEDNQSMLESFAEKINARDTGVTATVEVAETEEGIKTAALLLESDIGGETGSFDVLGTLAEKLEIARDGESPVQEAIYSIVKNIEPVEEFTSDTNNITVDDGITARIKGVGTANISSITDAAEGMADKVSKMVDQYNKTLSFLSMNNQRGLGVQNRLQRITEMPRSGPLLERIGVTQKKQGALEFERETFVQQARKEPSRTNEIVERFAEDMRTNAREAMKESSGSLVGPLEYVAREESRQLDPVNVLSTYSRNGVYNLMNLYAAGVLMNLNA